MIRLAALLVFVLSCTLGIYGCQQRTVRDSRFQADYNSVTQSPGLEVKNDDTIIISPFVTNSVLTSTADTILCAQAVRQAFLEQNYSNTVADERDAAQGGVRFYSALHNSHENRQALAKTLRLDYLSRFRHAKWLLTSSLDGVNNRSYKRGKIHSNVQNISINYKIWDLFTGRLSASATVSGYTYQGNEQFRATNGNTTQKELANTLHWLFDKETPESVQLKDLIVYTASEFITRVLRN
jgi:hypothetical protein